YSSDEDILSLFELANDYKLEDVGDDHVGRKIASDVIDMATGEIIATRDMVLDEALLAKLKESDAEDIKLYGFVDPTDEPLIARTISKDTSRNREDALESIYRTLRSSEPPDVETAELL